MTLGQIYERYIKTTSEMISAMPRTSKREVTLMHILNIHSSEHPLFFKGGGEGELISITFPGGSEQLKKEMEVSCRSRSS